MPVIFKGDAQSVMQPDPNYLESAELTSQDPQVVTYRLNPNFRWNNGRPADWTDFDAQWRALNATNPAFLVAGTTGYTEIAGVSQGATPQEVVVTYAARSPIGGAPSFRSSRGETNLDPAVFNQGWVASRSPASVRARSCSTASTPPPSGSRWCETRTGGASRHARPDHLPSASTRTAQPEAFANGSLSWFDIGPNVAYFQRAQQVPGVSIRTSNGPNYRHITFNGAPGSILEDPALRQAIMKGINRQVITQSQIGPIVPDARPLGNHLYVEGQAGYQDNSGVVAYDPEKLAGSSTRWAGRCRVTCGSATVSRSSSATSSPPQWRSATPSPGSCSSSSARSVSR